MILPWTAWFIAAEFIMGKRKYPQSYKAIPPELTSHLSICQLLHGVPQCENYVLGCSRHARQRYLYLRTRYIGSLERVHRNRLILTRPSYCWEPLSIGGCPTARQDSPRFMSCLSREWSASPR